MSVFVKLVMVFMLLLSGLSTSAATLTASVLKFNPLADATFLEDPVGQLTFEQVRAADAQFKHWAGPGKFFNFGFTTSAYWIKLPLTRPADAAEDWLLEIDYTKLQDLDFYAPDGTVVQTGSARAFASRPVFDRFFVFPLKLTPQSQPYYLRVTSRYALTVPLTVWTPNAYQASQQRFHALQFMYYGVLAVLAIYGLVIFLSIGDGLFAIYSAYIISAALGVFASNGYGRLFVWNDFIKFDEISQSLFLSLTAFFAVIFARRLVRLDSRSWLDRSLSLSQWIFALAFLLSLGHLVYSHLLLLTNQMLMLNSMLMGLLVTLAGFKAYRLDRSGIKYFLMGWIVLWLGVCGAALRAFGLIPTNGLTSYLVQITMAVEMLLVALALGEILRQKHLAHVATQALALEANQSLLNQSKASEEKLTQMVQERTNQLELFWREEKNLREQYVRIGSMISHEFRTPLSIIYSQAMLMRKEYVNGLDEVIKRLSVIEGASLRLKSMFDKWLHSDSLNERLTTLVLQHLDLESWVRQQLQVQQHLLTCHSVYHDTSLQAPEILADKYQLELVLSNLLDNAAKYSPAGSTITVGLQEKSGFLGMSVTDQGPGIPLMNQDKIFREFFRGSVDSQVRGMGLGLSIVQRIVQAHEGHVELVSTLGAGATFIIWLPCAS